MPQIKLKVSGMERTETLVKLIDTKLAQVERLLPKGVTDATFEVELGKATKHHKSGKIFRAETNISYKGTLHRAEGVAETIESAIDIMKNELKAELRKGRTKKKDAARAGSRTLKKMVRGG
jgi:ribosomal subunit interface protein